MIKTSALLALQIFTSAILVLYTRFGMKSWHCCKLLAAIRTLAQTKAAGLPFRVGRSWIGIWLC